MNSPRVLFHVQHLLGIGHLRRAALLVDAWRAAGMEVVLVSGGEPLTGRMPDADRLVQLPPLRAADSRFSALVDVTSGLAPDEAFWEARSERLLAVLDEVRPQLLVLESYPFGRRALRHELLPLLQAARRQNPRPRVLVSLRDVLQQRRSERVAESLALARRYCDYLLVHGDPDFLPLQASLPEIDSLGERLLYTGYVTDPELPAYQGHAEGEVVVSAGGGAVGARLLRTALEARPLTPFADQTWRLLLGPNLPPDERRALEARCPAGVILESLRSDFPRLLSRAALSVSQAGYNTLMDLLGVGCPAVLVPFEGEGETEQLTRARRLEAAGWGRLVPEAALTPAALATAMAEARARPPQPPPLMRDGARRSAHQLLGITKADAS